MSTKEAGELALSPTPRRSLIRYRWKWIAFVTLVVLAGAVSSDKLQHRTYVSSSSVVLGPQIFGDGAEPLSPDMGTAKAVASTTVVLAPAAQTLGMTVADLRKALTVTVPADTNLLTFTAKGTTPLEAQQRAAVITKDFVAYQNAPLATVRKQVAAATSGGARTSTLIVEPATLVTPADLPKIPSGHSLKLDLIVALIAGMGLGVGVALLVDRSSNSIAGQGDLEDQLGRPVLSVVPKTRRSRRPFDPVRAILDSPELLSSYRALRVRLQDLSPKGQPFVVSVTRPHQGVEPQLPTAIGLAVSFALSGRRTLLMGADIGAGTMGRLFGLQQSPGVAELLAKGSTWQAPLESTAIPDLMLIPEGCARVGAEDLFDQSRLSRLFSTLGRSCAEVIVVDSPALLDAPESLVVVGAANRVVVDVDRRRTERSDLRAMLPAMAGHQDDLVGAVATQGASRRRRRAGTKVAAAAPGSDQNGQGTQVRPQAETARGMTPLGTVETGLVANADVRLARGHLQMAPVPEGAVIGLSTHSSNGSWRKS
jgi:capsular polysaccharide biosynthesis protein